MKFAALLSWALAKPMIGLLCLLLGIALLWAAAAGLFGRIPVLERMVGQGVPPKVRRKQFLTRVEQETLRHLETAFPQFRVHCQVSMGALLSPERWLGRNDALWTHRLYSQKIVDYVLQDRRTGEVIALVELDDATHRHRRDHARDVLTDTAGYRTIRLAALRRPTLASVRETVSLGLE
jgi:hypothetical protein